MNIGLKIADNPDAGASLGLADILAKGIFGDPEGQMKARALASEVGQRMAARDKLLADTGLVNIKSREEQALADAQDAAAAHPDALVASVPSPAQPIPVEAPRANAPGNTGYGPQPGIVSPEAQATYDSGVRMHDAQVATLKNLWPVIVRSGNSTQVIEALGKGEGLGALSGGLVPGAKVDPDTQRVAGGLYTGTAPSETTVWSPGDTAGVDAAARKDIAVAAAKPKEPNVKEFAGQPYIINADGSLAKAPGFTPQPTYRDVNGGVITLGQGPDGRPIATPVQGAEPQPKAPERQMIGDVLHERQPDGSWRPVQGPAAPLAKAPERQVVDGVVYERDPLSGKWAPATGIAPPAPKGAFGDSESGTEKNIVEAITARLRDPNYTPTPDEAQRFAIAHTSLYGPKDTVTYDDKGNPRVATVWPDVPGYVHTPEDVFSRAHMPPPPPGRQRPTDPQAAAPPPVSSPAPSGPPLAGPTAQTAPAPAPTPQGPPAPPAAAPAGPTTRPVGPRVVVTSLGEPVPPPPSEDENKARQFAPQLAQSSADLDKLKPEDLPSSWGFNRVMRPGDTLTDELLRNYTTAPSTKKFGQAATQYMTSHLYRVSGAQISEPEFNRGMQAFIPQPGDDQPELDRKTRARHAFIRTIIDIGYSKDPNARQRAIDAVKAGGLDIDADPGAPAPANPKPGAPRRQTYDAQGNLR